MSTTPDSVSAQVGIAPVWAGCDAYIFDIDGTLINTRDGVHYNAFHSAMQKVFGIESKIDGLPVHGNTDIGILRALAHREGLCDPEFEAGLPRVLEHMCAEVERNAANIYPEVCPSIKQFLDVLISERKLLGVASGNLERIGWAKLRAAGLADCFSFGSFSDHAEFRHQIFRNAVNEAKRRLGKKATVCAIGDTPNDIHAAHEIGVPVIAIATGVFKVEELRQHHPDLCVASCTGIVSSF